MRSYIGIAVDPTTFEETPDDLLGLELEGFREVDLGDAKITLMLLRWTSDKSAEASLLRSLINGADGEEQNSD